MLFHMLLILSGKAGRIFLLPIKEKENKSMKLTLETQRLLLRPFAIGDIQNITEITSRPNVSHYMTDMVFDTPEKAAAWIQELDRICNENEPCVLLAIVPKGTSIPIGYIGLHPKDTLDYEVEILYALADEHQSNGYMTEAGKAITGWCFQNTPVPFIAAIVQHSNIASTRVVEKLGFRYEGEKTLPHNGIMTHFHYYRLYA
jgi:ribosomal-protein-alanine N-acetyltransferase